MKMIMLLVCLIGLSFAGAAQTTTEAPRYFAQCMLNIDDETTFRNLEEELRANPFVSVVRLDWITKRAFVLTKDLTSLSIDEFRTWLGESANSATCIQVGLHGTDQVNPFPFTNCEN